MCINVIASLMGTMLKLTSPSSLIFPDPEALDVDFDFLVVSLFMKVSNKVFDHVIRLVVLDLFLDGLEPFVVAGFVKGTQFR